MILDDQSHRMAMCCQSFHAFGLLVESDFDLPGLQARSAAGPSARLLVAQGSDIDAAWAGPTVDASHAVLGDGTVVSFERGQWGDYLISLAGDRFHIVADGSRILCAPLIWSDWAWQRQLLDTVLFSASFARGYELLHASAIAASDGAAAFVGPTGVGKTTLLAELLGRGYRLFADDIVAVNIDESGVVSFPGPAVMNLPDTFVGPERFEAIQIADFPLEHESWVSVPDAVIEPMPLKHIFILDPQQDGGRLTRMAGTTVLDLFPFTVSLPHDAARARRRFTVLSEVVDRTAVARLGRIGASPQALADQVEAYLSTT